MKAKVYHWDMTDRIVGFDLMFQPEPAAVQQVWKTGGFRLAYEVEVSDKMETPEALEAVFAMTQDTGRARSTSVGDVVILDEGQAQQAWVVSSIGFTAVTI
jgi:hypothetical protein